MYIFFSIGKKCVSIGLSHMAHFLTIALTYSLSMEELSDKVLVLSPHILPKVCAYSSNS